MGVVVARSSATPLGATRALWESGACSSNREPNAQRRCSSEFVVVVAAAADSRRRVRIASSARAPPRALRPSDAGGCGIARDGQLVRGAKLEVKAERRTRRSRGCSVQYYCSASLREDTAAAEPLATRTSLYRPCVVLPGLGNNTTDYDRLVSDLEARSVAATVVQVSRPDWLRNAAGLIDGNYWRGTLSPRPVLDWYLERVRNAVASAKLDGGGHGKVSLIGHSAGGWLARVYMAEFGTEDVALLLTLGTPHMPPPRGTPGVFDQTRGLLYFVEENCPGAYHAPDVKYVCVAGRYLKGGKFREEQMTPVATTGVGTLNREEVAGENNLASETPVQGVAIATEAPPTFRARLVGAGYKQVCGKADVWGDGVVPEESAYLEGALNICLDGVYHSPVGSNDTDRLWYGSTGVLDKWVQHLLE